jgi:hypothetical protein
MPVSVLVGLSTTIIVLSVLWSRLFVSNRVRYQPCGYRMVRPNRNPAVVIGNGFGIGLLVGLGLVLLVVALAG